jgi:bis(5'-nucleosyl)-tetraphosphatase (symmetrical)
VVFLPVQDRPGVDAWPLGCLLLGEPQFEPSLPDVLSQGLWLKIRFLWFQYFKSDGYELQKTAAPNRFRAQIQYRLVNMAVYAIGDVQGCFDALERLFDAISYNQAHDRLWFVGDLVNRGPESLATLRLVRSLGDSALTVLGNHDFHLLALAAGHAKKHRSDTLDPILEAPDRVALLDWLRHRPLFHVEGSWAMVHAGLLPQWSVATAQLLAQEVEAALRGSDWQQFLANLYGDTPDSWDEGLHGADRLRVIVNTMARMRFCTAEGKIELRTKGETAKAPPGYYPWFDAPARASGD